MAVERDPEADPLIIQMEFLLGAFAGKIYGYGGAAAFEFLDDVEGLIDSNILKRVPAEADRVYLAALPAKLRIFLEEALSRSQRKP
ncbi:hypothetical protein FG93_05513 [Bosea sp. LC85]|nr:hypothetical protein FG93_05513 [Bosea sp. LC85]